MNQIQYNQNQYMDATIDEAFIRRAIGFADLDAVRLGLYQNTGDPQLGALPMAAHLDAAGRALLVDKAVAWLQQHAGPAALEVPSSEQLRALIELTTGGPTSETEFEFRREIPAFTDFPWIATWSDGKPELPEGFQVAVIGGGFSGIAMGVQLSQLGIPYVLLERRHELGGTWSINRYPDIRVDTISISYEYGFEKNYPWTEYFARGSEVRKYLNYIAEKYDVGPQMQFDSDVKKAAFDERRNVWVLEVQRSQGTEIIEANAIICATGTFANPNLPRFEDQQRYEGKIVHPSRWPDDLDLEGSNVAIIGNGSTGVQLLAPIAEQARRVHVFQRTPQWISPRDNYGKPVEPEIRWLLDNFPGYWNWSRYMATHALFDAYKFYLPDQEWKAKGGFFNPMVENLRENLISYITDQTGGRQDLIDQLVPDYAPFARRPVVDNGWYRALTRDNVELVTDPIARLTPKGIQTTDGRTREVDVIVTATGFEVMRYLWPAQFVGRGGIEITDAWSSDGPRAYIGMMVPRFPNMFILYGPNSQPLQSGHGLPSWYVIWSAYAAKCLVQMLEQNKSRVEVKDEAFQRYNQALDAKAATMLWLQSEAAPEKNYYVNRFGRLQVNAPWWGPDYHRMCTQLEWEDLDIT
jgi:4-hydroxyacetophenone monooxygenase